MRQLIGDKELNLKEDLVLLPSEIQMDPYHQKQLELEQQQADDLANQQFPDVMDEEF